MHRWSFNLQVYFLSHRFKVHKKIIESKQSVVQDRSIYEDVEIFARNLYELGRMKKRDYQNYRNLFREMTHFLKPPDLLVYLSASLPKLENQIKLRGRDYEKNIDTGYLKRLNDSYEEWIKSYRLGKTLIIQSDKMDFVNRRNDLKKILSSIEENLE
jgi:deoxyadenosine/deoxycytidine kinase